MIVTGCLIIKDEEASLAEALKSLQPFTDEIVVYDTGSTDASKTIARDLGAILIEGYWDDDFAAARNRALAWCRGEWVLVLDADEVIQGDPTAWRRELSGSAATVLAVEQRSGLADGSGRQTSVWLTRALRGGVCHWAGALHEQVVARHGELVGDLARTVRLQHSGYLPHRMADGRKAGRNLRIASSELESCGADEGRRPQLLLNLGRSATAAGEHNRALEVFEELNVLRPDLPRMASAAGSAVQSALAVRDFALGRTWVGRLRRAGENVEVCRAMEAAIAHAEGDHALVVLSLEGMGPVLLDHSGTPQDTSLHEDWLADAWWHLGQEERAVEILTTHVLARRSNTHPAIVVDRLSRVPGALDTLVAGMPGPHVSVMAGDLARAGAGLDVFLGAVWDSGRSRASVLDYLSHAPSCIGPDGLLTWVERLQSAGHPSTLFLRAVAVHRGVQSLSRLVAAALLVEAGDAEALPLLQELLGLVPPEEEHTVLAVLAHAAPVVATFLAPT